jgi:predicted kinase
MTKLIITRGIPASGKTTWALEWVAEEAETKRVRINRDDIRFMLFGRYTRVDEFAVTKMQDSMLRTAMKSGHDIVLDNMNLYNKHVKDVLKIARDFYYEVEYKDFYITLSEAVERDSKRERQVGEEVIKMLFKRHLPKDNFPVPPEVEMTQVFKPYAPNTELPPAYIFDIDGTLAHIDPENPRDVYDGTRAEEDHLDPHVSKLLFLLSDQAMVHVILLSGRSESCRAETEAWLDTHEIPYSGLFMRAEGDGRKDSIIKNELFRAHVEPSYHALGVFDDRNQVVDMWRQIGLKCFQVQEGDF